MLVTAKPVIDAPGDQEHARQLAERPLVDGEAKANNGEHHDADGERMADRDGDQRDEHHAAAMAVEP